VSKVLGRVALAMVVVASACVSTNDDEQSSGIQRNSRGIVSAQPGPAGVNASQLPSDKFLTYVEGKPILPAYRTEWERELERKAREARAKGLPYADQYDDYRNQNIGDFFITKPPTTTTIRTPAEYEQSQAYVLNWLQGTSGDAQMFGQIVKGAWGVVPVLMVYNSTTHKSWIEQQLMALGYSSTAIQNPANIIWWQHVTDGWWTRDYGPVSLVTTTAPAKLSFVDYRYYHYRVHDDQVPTDLAQAWGINVFRPSLDFEGGNFMNTSDMLCAMTKGVMNYNPQLTQSAIEDILKQYQACKKFVWPSSMTGGVIEHIDMFSKFASDTSVLVGEYTSSQDAANYSILNANANLFASTTTPTGKTVNVTRIPMPNKGGSAGNYTWRTYTNSLSLYGAAGKVVLIPVYAQETSKEAAAMAAYAAVYPGWTLVKVTSDNIIPLQGATHCITMQIPVAQKAKMEADPGDQCGPTALSCTGTTGCGSITYQGCCDGEVLKWCENNALQTIDCSGNPSCGWQASAGYYDCGTSGAADPSGTYPKNCGTTPPTDMGVPTDAPPTGCGNITYEGCCDGETLKYCENNAIQTIDCTQNPSCGWQASAGYYDCATSGGADPSGVHPKACGTTPLPDQFVPPQPDQYVPPQPDQYVPPQPDQYIPPTYDQYVPIGDGFGPLNDGLPPAGDGIRKKGGGCGCEVAATPSASTLLMVGLLLGLVLVSRRRE
jgi:agmatine deiminase